MAIRKRGNGSEAPTKEKKSRRERKRAKNDGLGSVVKESAPGTAIDLLNQNGPMVLPGDSGWLVLLLNTNDEAIGGLSASKAKGNEDKGSIIELIDGAHISVVMTPELLEKDILGIIPDEGTLGRMKEFGLLRNAPYYWGVVQRDDDDGLVIDAPVKATFDEAVALSNGNTSVAELLPAIYEWAMEGVEGQDETDASSDSPFAPEAAFEEAPDDTVVEGIPAVQEPEPAAPEQIEEQVVVMDDGAIDDGVDYSVLAADDEADDDGEFVDEDEAQEDDGFDVDPDEEVDTYQDYVTENYDREVDQDEVRETILRRFSHDSLDLVVTEDEFEAILRTEVPVVQIEAGDTTDWLGQQVAELAAQANSELRRMRDDGNQVLRTQFAEMMALQAEKVYRDTSLTTEGTPYFEMMRAADEQRDASRRKATQRVAEIRKEINDDFDKQADDSAKAAAEAERARVNAHNKALRQRRLSAAQPEYEASVEAVWESQKGIVLDLREEDARLRMDMGKTRVLKVIVENQAVMREQEQRVAEEWQKRILEIIDENRKADISRAEALAENLARTNKVEEMRTANAEEMALMEQRIAALQEENDNRMRAARDEALAKIREVEEIYRTQIEAEQGRTEQANGLVSNLSAQITALKGSMDEQYQGRIKALEADRQSFEEELDRSAKSHKRMYMVFAALVLVLAVAAFAVGIIVGWTFQGDEGAAQAAGLVGLAPPGA